MKCYNYHHQVHHCHQQSFPICHYFHHSSSPSSSSPFSSQSSLMSWQSPQVSHFYHHHHLHHYYHQVHQYPPHLFFCHSHQHTPPDLKHPLHLSHQIILIIIFIVIIVIGIIAALSYIFITIFRLILILIYFIVFSLILLLIIFIVLSTITPFIFIIILSLIMMSNIFWQEALSVTCLQEWMNFIIMNEFYYFKLYYSNEWIYFVVFVIFLVRI